MRTVRLSQLRLIIDKAWPYAKILLRIFRESRLEMCKCAHECCHKRFQAKAKALQGIFARHVYPCDEATKLRRLKQLRTLYSRHDAVEVELILDWLAENGLPGDRGTTCVDVLQWSVANNCRHVLAKAKEQRAIQLKLSKDPRDTPELVSEAAAASAIEARQLAMFKKEYPTAEERQRKISAEISQIRLDLGAPDLSGSREIVTYAIARICRRIELALPLLDKPLAG
jgi:hypothetical protein